MRDPDPGRPADRGPVSSDIWIPVMKISGLAMVAAVLGLLAGCDDDITVQTENDSESLATGDARILLYDCPGAIMEVHYLDDAVQFAWEGMSYRLPQVPSDKVTGPEARYATDNAELWNRGSEVRVRLPGVGAMSCSQLPADSVPRYPSLNPTDSPQ